jgi:hypothetical protein
LRHAHLHLHLILAGREAVLGDPGRAARGESYDFCVFPDTQATEGLDFCGIKSSNILLEGFLDFVLDAFRAMAGAL